MAGVIVKEYEADGKTRYRVEDAYGHIWSQPYETRAEADAYVNAFNRTQDQGE